MGRYQVPIIKGPIMKPRLFTVVIQTKKPVTLQMRVKTDNELDRVLGRLQAITGNVEVRYREQGAAYQTYDRQAVIRRCGGYREYGCFIGRSVL